MLESSGILSSFPSGRFGVAVSGGADSVALLRLALLKPDLELHVVHLDHETRAGESARDADFVRQLASQFNLPVTISRRSEVESMAAIPRCRNRSEHFRRCRYALMAHASRQCQLDGVLVAHHRNDFVETVAIRLLRGTGYRALPGMKREAQVHGVRVVRPLLACDPGDLRLFLTRIGQDWREDISNRAGDQLRNRVRQILSTNPGIADALADFARSISIWNEWVDARCPEVCESVDCRVLAKLCTPVARALLTRWLRQVSPPGVIVERPAVDRLIAMCTDASTPVSQTFPGGVQLRRSRQQVLLLRRHCPSGSSDIRIS